MSSIVFIWGTEIITVTIKEKSVYFTNQEGTTTINGLRLSKSGVEKEFPDLVGNENWRLLAIQRFKDKINSFKNEEEIMKYLISDLKKYGYIPKQIKKDGSRTKNIK